MPNSGIVGAGVLVQRVMQWRGDLYVCGRFRKAGAEQVNFVARWDGQHFHPLGSGMNDWVYDLVAFDEDGPGPLTENLFALGQFTTAGGVPAKTIARWDGERWSAVGETFASTGQLFAFRGKVLEVDGPWQAGPALYIVGRFDRAGATVLNNVGRWNGTTWESVGGGVSSPQGYDPRATDLAAFDEDGPGPQPAHLFIGGWFRHAGGTFAEGIARFDGTAWRQVGNGLSGWLYPLQPQVWSSGSIFDIDATGPQRSALVVTGFFSFAGGVLADQLAAWDGERWLTIPGFEPRKRNGGHAAVFGAYTGRVDGVGPSRLYINGDFDSVGDVLSPALSSWNGADWGLVPGFSGVLAGLADIQGNGGIPGGLYAFGAVYGASPFQSVGNVIRLTCDLGPCLGDVNGDRRVDPDDLMLLLTTYGRAGISPVGDLNQDGKVDFLDLSMLLAAFGTSC